MGDFPRLYTNTIVILCKVLEHLQILVCGGAGVEPITRRYQEMTVPPCLSQNPVREERTAADLIF